MSIQFCCTNCSQPIEVDEEHAGKTAACPYCRHMVTVPQQSTYNASAAIDARPAAGPGAPEYAETLGALDVPPVAHRRPPVSLPRQRAAATFGAYALICALLALVLFGIGAIGSVTIAFKNLSNDNGALSMSPSDIEKMQTALTQHPWISAVQFGGLFFALAGLVLAIISLTQSARGNWRGIVSVVVCGVFLLCLCTGVVFATLSGFGLPAPH